MVCTPRAVRSGHRQVRRFLRVAARVNPKLALRGSEDRLSSANGAPRLRARQFRRCKLPPLRSSRIRSTWTDSRGNRKLGPAAFWDAGHFSDNAVIRPFDFKPPSKRDDFFDL